MGKEKTPIDWSEETYVYVLRLENGEEYVGVTRNMLNRLTNHLAQNGMGASATMNSRPIEILHCLLCIDRRSALNLEKHLHKIQKDANVSIEEWLNNNTIDTTIPIKVFPKTLKILVHKKIKQSIRLRSLTCKRGHLWSENTYTNPNSGQRACKLCHRENAKLSQRRGLERRVKNASKLHD